MKYCRYCGSEMYDEALICMKCGCPVEQAPVSGAVESAKPKLNPVALVGFILSIVSAFVAIILLFGSEEIYFVGMPFDIAGLVCSIIGLVMVKRKKQRGKGFAIAGLVVGAVVCAIWLLALMIVFYSFLFIYMFLILLLGAAL